MTIGISGPMMFVTKEMTNHTNRMYRTMWALAAGSSTASAARAAGNAI